MSRAVVGLKGGDSPAERAAGLACWTRPVAPEPVGGGISNHNFLVSDGGARFFVRIGDDFPVHGVRRVNEVAASRAAHAAGISPEVVHVEPGAMVLRYIENGRAFGDEDVRRPANLARMVALVRRCHTELPRHLAAPLPAFRVFEVIRGYAARLAGERSRLAGALPRYLELAAVLEAAAGPMRPVLGHNDCLAANFIDDGERLWLIDWEYAGYNDALFDLGGISAHSGLAPEQEAWLLEAYYGAPASPDLWRRYAAMKCVSALREGLWSAVSEHHMELDFDYQGYTDEHLGRFERAYDDFLRLPRA